MDSSPKYIIQEYTANTEVVGKGYALIFASLARDEFQVNTNNTLASLSITTSVVITIDSIGFSINTGILRSRSAKSSSGSSSSFASAAAYGVGSCGPMRIDFMNSFKCSGNIQKVLIYLEQEDNSSSEELSD